MENQSIAAATAVPLAERTLAALREVKEIVEHPPALSEEMLAMRLSPNRIARAYLADAAEDLAKAIPLPDRGNAGTSISRESVSMMLEAPIAYLERFIVQAKLAVSRGQEPPPGSAHKHLLLAGSVIMTLLAATATFPPPDPPTASEEGGAADAGTFRDAGR